MISIIRKYSIESIWHFTDRSNIDLINKCGGILSLSELESRGIEIPRPGGNEWSHDADKCKGLESYVHLTFVPDHPMLYVAKQEGRISNPIWIKIDPSVILEPDVRFSSDVSNKSGVEILDHERAKSELDFDVLFTWLDWRVMEINQRRQRAVKSEILVPKIIPTSKIVSYHNG